MEIDVSSCYYLCVKHSQKFLQVNDKDEIVQYEFSDGDNQKWEFIPAQEKCHYYIVTKHSRKCLSTDINSRSLKLASLQKTGNDFQKWKIKPVNGGYCLIFNKYKKKERYLNVLGKNEQEDEAEVNIYGSMKPENHPNQYWKLIKTD